MLLIARVKANEQLLDQPPKEHTKNSMVLKCENELEQELSRQQPDEDIILRHIMALASQEYAATTADQDLLRERIKKTIRRIEIQKGFDTELFILQYPQYA